MQFQMNIHLISKVFKDFQEENGIRNTLDSLIKAKNAESFLCMRNEI